MHNKRVKYSRDTIVGLPSYLTGRCTSPSGYLAQSLQTIVKSPPYAWFDQIPISANEAGTDVEAVDNDETMVQDNEEEDRNWDDRAIEKWTLEWNSESKLLDDGESLNCSIDI